ncbi:MAG TPA: hypothetical protein VGM85_09750 [Paraburkholderia sp.]|jgi:hypothetical protein
MKWKAYVLAVGTLAASLPAFANTAFANTASDNIAWSAKPAAAIDAQVECTAYSGRQVTDTNDAAADPLAKTLKIAGTLAALAAVSVTTKASSTTAPNPCRRF